MFALHEASAHHEAFFWCSFVLKPSCDATVNHPLCIATELTAVLFPCRLLQQVLDCRWSTGPDMGTYWAATRATSNPMTASLRHKWNDVCHVIASTCGTTSTFVDSLAIVMRQLSRQHCFLHRAELFCLDRVNYLAPLPWFYRRII